MMHMTGSMLHYHPIVIHDADGIYALIWLDSYDTQARTCKVHYLTGNTKRAVSVAGAAVRALDGILANGDIDVLFGFVPADSPNAQRTARMFGFKEFAYSQDLVYMARSS
jgi:hypothetical protein